MAKKCSLILAGAAVTALVMPVSAAPIRTDRSQYIHGDKAKSITELQEMIKMGIFATPELKPTSPMRGRIPTTGMMLNGPTGGDSKIRGGTSEVTPACFSPRTQLACGTYEVLSTFEAEHGPFARALGNHEDYELTNGTAGFYCTIDGDDADCTVAFDTPFGPCAAPGPSIDAGDILSGVAVREGPPRPKGGFNGTLISAGAGFQGSPSKWQCTNYFGDTHDIKFPRTPDACGTADAKPLAVGFDVMCPFGCPNGVTATATLEDGSTFAWTVPAPARASAPQFSGLCCTQGITKVALFDDAGGAPGSDNARWTSAQGTCNPDLVPLSLEDTRIDMECLADALAALELKLDSGGTGGSRAKVSGLGVGRQR